MEDHERKCSTGAFLKPLIDLRSALHQPRPEFTSLLRPCYFCFRSHDLVFHLKRHLRVNTYIEKPSGMRIPTAIRRSDHIGRGVLDVTERYRSLFSRPPTCRSEQEDCCPIH